MFSYSGIRRVAVVGAGVSACTVILVSAILSSNSPTHGVAVIDGGKVKS